MTATQSHHYRALLARQTEHFTAPEQAAVTACLELARDLVRDIDAGDDGHQDILAHTVALKLLTLLPHAPPQWVRVLIGKAAMEHPVPLADRIDAHSVLLNQAVAACQRAA